MKMCGFGFQKAVWVLSLVSLVTSCDGAANESMQPQSADGMIRVVSGLDGDIEPDVLFLRATATEPDLDKALPAIAELGERSLDRVSIEVLNAIARSTVEERRLAAVDALLTIGERALVAGDPQTAAGIGSFIFLSSMPKDRRERAWPLFAAWDSPALRRNRHLASPYGAGD